MPPLHELLEFIAMPSPPDIEMTQLGETLAKLRDLDGHQSLWRRPKYRVFGSKRHRYELLPPLIETQLLDFETRHNLELPPDYRLFLQQVGNGPVGPSYGLFPLHETCGDTNLTRPFALERDSHLYSDEELTALGFDDEVPGALRLCHHGCGMHSYLVVNGPTYGTIWFEDADIRPMGIGFLEWYSSWAEGQLRWLSNEPVVKKLKRGMTKEQVIALTGGDWQEREVTIQPTLITTRYFEAPDFHAQLKLDERGRVIEIKRR